MTSKPLLLALVLSSLPGVASARVSRICKVSYETTQAGARWRGWSDEYRIEVTFMSSAKLNKATQSWDYDPWSNCGLIWFEEGEVAILEHDGLVFGVGKEFDNRNFRDMFSSAYFPADFNQVNSEDERAWRVTAKENSRFIDPRAKQ